MNAPASSPATAPALSQRQIAGLAVLLVVACALPFVLGTELKLTVALVLIVGVLVIRPSGLFGKVHVTRV